MGENQAIVLSFFSDRDSRQSDEFSNLLFVRLYSEIVRKISLEKREEDGKAVFSAISEQINEFGGDQLDNEANFRAWKQVMKLLNFGLEYVLSQADPPVSGDERETLAIAILSQKPLGKVYEIGKGIFKKNQAIALSFLERSVIRLGDFWFCLIDEKDRKSLEVLSDLDVFDGKWETVKGCVSVCIRVEKVLAISPLLPITEKASRQYFLHFGSTDKKVFPSSVGLIRVFLNSLLIAAMFRREEEFCLPRLGFLSHLGAENFLNVSIAMGYKDEKIDQMLMAQGDIRDKIRYGIEDFFCPARNQEEREEKYHQLASALALTLDEIRLFTEQLFSDPEEFRKQAPTIKKRFLQYFDIAYKVLGLKHLPANVIDYVIGMLSDFGQQLVLDVLGFYHKGLNPKSDDLVIFWRPRLIIEKIVGSAYENEVMKVEAKREVSVNTLLKLSPEELIAHLAAFSLWPKEKQWDFIARFNPNVLARTEEIDFSLVSYFIRLFYHLFPSAPGWNLNNKIVEKAVNDKAETALTLYEGLGMRYTLEMIDKINWKVIHPSLVAELWLKGSDVIRDLFFERLSDGRIEIKMTIPALKRYYFEEHKDLRLLEFVLSWFFNQDRLTKETWKDLIDSAKLGGHNILLTFLENLKTKLQRKKSKP